MLWIWPAWGFMEIRQTNTIDQKLERKREIIERKRREDRRKN